MPLCVGFLGENGAGKSTALRMIREALKDEYSSKELRFSKPLGETLKIWGIEENRANLQLLAQVMDRTYGQGTLSRALFANAKGLQEEILLVDGVRWLTDETAIRSFENNILVYVTASSKTRFNRLLRRGEKIGENTMTWEQFCTEDVAPNEMYTSVIGSRADFVIRDEVNILTIAPVVQRIREILK